MAHPCHPLSGYQFVPIRVFNSLGVIRVEFLGPDGVQTSLPAGCTDLSGEDPYIEFANETTLLKLPELVILCDIVNEVDEKIKSSGLGIF